MSQISAESYDFSQAGLSGVFFVDQAYSEKHAHMIHQHADVMELLYIASGEGRYFVKNREYAVHTGDLIICNADTLHGETPFQNHSMQTYCCAFSGISLPKLPKGCLTAKEQRPVLKLESYAAAIGRIMPTIYELFSSSPDHAAICRQLAISLLMMSWSSLQEHNHQGNLLLEQKNEVLLSRITEYLNLHIYRTAYLKKHQQGHAYQRIPFVPSVQTGNRAVPHPVYDTPQNQRSPEPVNGNQPANSSDRRNAGLWKQLSFYFHVQKICGNISKRVPKSFPIRTKIQQALNFGCK